jgi:hypothetical protein
MLEMIFIIFYISTLYILCLGFYFILPKKLKEKVNTFFYIEK